LLPSLTLLLATALASPPLTAQFLCTAGVQPDGFVNWNNLPAAPLITNGTSTPVTATIPVDGAPGLTATVQIPALTGSSPTPVPAYTVNGDQLLLNGFASGGQGTTITITFNKGIAGASVSGAIGGTINTLTLTAFNARNPQNILNFSGKSSNDEFVPLQVRASQPNYITSLQLGISAFLSPQLPATWSNLRIESGQAPILGSLGIVPMNGLMQWLPTEAASGTDWLDFSNNGHDATQTNPAIQPATVFDGPNCRRTVVFTNNAFLNFTLPISGWSQMTVFLVAKSNTDSAPGQFGSFDAAIFWNENQLWGNTFVSPYWTNVAFRFGTTEVGNTPNYKRPATVGGDFTLTTAVHDQSTDSLWVNGTKVFHRTGNLTALGGTDGTGFLGRGVNNSYFNGEIGEVLVYNRVLNNQEMQAVTGYLETKFGLLPGAP
jgi:hypothetical protein